MRGTDLGIEPTARIEVMVDPAGARPFETLRLFQAHQSQRETQFERRMFRTNTLAGRRQMLNLARSRSSHAAHHAVAARTAGDRDPRALAQLLDRLHFVNRDVCARNLRLRAIATILRADTTLCVAQDADLYATPEGRLTHFQ